MLEYRGIKIFWLGHAGFKIRNKKIIYIDPYETKPAEPADLILITHEHFDHFSRKDIKKVLASHTIAVCPHFCKLELSELGIKEILIVEPGKKYFVNGIEIEAVPAYNINKFNVSGTPYHPKAEKKVGYVISIEGVRIYHAGDTDFIPEMKNLENIDIALLPVSGTYVMTAEEAAKAANTIQPKIAVPMHIGSLIGNKADAERFRALAKCRVHILEKE
jgi:L-ascorbate metabolism protein UlaG (beta-lactamase superfamily)